MHGQRINNYQVSKRVLLCIHACATVYFAYERKPEMSVSEFRRDPGQANQNRLRPSPPRSGWCPKTADFTLCAMPPQMPARNTSLVGVILKAKSENWPINGPHQRPVQISVDFLIAFTRV